MAIIRLAQDTKKDTVIFVNDLMPQFVPAVEKLSARLGRPLQGIILIDAERKESGKYSVVDGSGFEELVVEFSDDAALTKALKPLEDRLLLISCDAERSQLYFKKVIPHVPYVNVPTESSMVFSTHKGKMRELLAAYDETISPRAVAVSDASDESIARICEHLAFPLIVKPTNLSSSMLVDRADGEDDLRRILRQSFESLMKIYSKYRGLGEQTMVVEEFVQGNLYSTDVYVDACGTVYVLPFIHFQNGVDVGMKSYQVYRDETYHTLTDDDRRRGSEVAVSAVHAIGLRSSVAHIELFHTPDGWRVVELGARPGGYRQELYEVSYGIDHAYNELLVKVGLEPEMPGSLKTYCSTFSIHAPKNGTVTAVSGIKEARMHPRMHSLRVHVKPGDKVATSTDGGTEAIEGLMFGDDPVQLDHDIADIRKLIRVNIE